MPRTAVVALVGEIHHKTIIEAPDARPHKRNAVGCWLEIPKPEPTSNTHMPVPAHCMRTCHTLTYTHILAVPPARITFNYPKFMLIMLILFMHVIYGDWSETVVGCWWVDDGERHRCEMKSPGYFSDDPHYTAT